MCVLDPYAYPENGNRKMWERNCPIIEVTGDGVHVGRCFFYLDDEKTCPRHGDVSKYVKIYKETGETTSENVMLVDRGQKPFGEKK